MKIKIPPSRLDYLVREWLCDEVHRLANENGPRWERKHVEVCKDIIRRRGKLTFVTTEEGTSVEMNVSVPSKKRGKKNEP